MTSEIRIDLEFDAHQRLGLLVRCGWMRSAKGYSEVCGLPYVFVEIINNVARIVPIKEYNAIVREATRRVDNPYADDLTAHYSAILADWSE